MISFIGAGKVGTALGVYFKEKGCNIGGYYNRTTEHAVMASEITKSKVFATIEELMSESSMVWITVSDDALPELAQDIAQKKIPPNIEAFVHTSGAHSSGVLQPIQEAGFATYCAHPLMAFSDIAESIKQLRKTYFTLDSTNDEIGTFKLQYLEHFFKQIGNNTLYVDADKKELYHCAAAVLSNYMVTLLNLSYEMFAESGMSRSEIKEATHPLLNSTLVNIEKHRVMSEALTGAIKRGDATTIAKHLSILKKKMPNKLALYKVLGKETMLMIEDYKLKEMFL